MIKKVAGGWTVVHCSGKDKGKRMSKKPMSRRKALAMHRAIQMSKRKRGYSG